MSTNVVHITARHKLNFRVRQAWNRLSEDRKYELAYEAKVKNRANAFEMFKEKQLEQGLLAIFGSIANK